MESWITIPGCPPAKSNTYRIVKVGGHSSLTKTKALLTYEQAFYWHNFARGLDIRTPFTFEVRVFFPSVRNDLDNSLKVLLDCLQQCRTIRNDNLCCRIVAEKFVDKAAPRVEFRLSWEGEQQPQTK